MLTELRLNNPRDFKFGWAYKSGMHWFFVFVTSVPVVNIICLLAWYYLGIYNFFSNLPSSMEFYKRVQIKVLRTNSKGKEERTLQWFKTCQYCGCSDHQHMPEFKIVAGEGGKSIYQLDCQVCSSVVAADTIEEMLELWNEGSDDQRFNRWKRRVSKETRIKTYLLALWGRPNKTKEIDLFGYGDIWENDK